MRLNPQIDVKFRKGKIHMTLIHIILIYEKVQMHGPGPGGRGPGYKMAGSPSVGGSSSMVGSSSIAGSSSMAGSSPWTGSYLVA